MGDNVDVARALALVHVHTARALFFIILIILKAKLIFLIYLISTPRRAWGEDSARAPLDPYEQRCATSLQILVSLCSGSG